MGLVTSVKKDMEEIITFWKKIVKTNFLLEKLDKSFRIRYLD